MPGTMSRLHSRSRSRDVLLRNGFSTVEPIEMGVFEAARRFDEEKQNRKRTDVALDVFELLPGESSNAGESVAEKICPAGSITFIWGLETCTAVRNARSTFAGDVAAHNVEQCCSALVDIAQRRRRSSSINAVVSDITQNRSIVDIRYGSKVLAANVALPFGAEFGVTTLEWNGDLIDSSQLSIAEYALDGMSKAISGFAVVRPPRPTGAEQAAETLLDGEGEYDGIKAAEFGAAVYATPGVCTPYLIVHLHAVGGPDARLWDEDLDATLGEKNWRDNLRPGSSVAELIRVRRKLVSPSRN